MQKFVIQEITASETWPLRHMVMYPDYPAEYVKLENDDEGIHFGGYMGEELVSVVSLFIKGKDAQFRKLATLEKHQGKGFATQILNHIISFSKKQNCTKIWCNARANKTNFYHTFGIKETPQTYTKSGINFIIMERNY